jgi:hypothetical protein
VIVNAFFAHVSVTENGTVRGTSTSVELRECVLCYEPVANTDESIVSTNSEQQTRECAC